jgi:hypothetical protein
MRIRCRLPVVVLLPVMAVQSVAAEEDVATEDDTYKRCINSGSIRSTSVENDRSIVFHMRGRKIYLNALPASCPGLAREGRFSYTTYGSRLCRSDLIRVIDHSGFGLLQGRACRLGGFQLVTKEDLADLFEDRDRPIEPKEVETPTVEDIAPDNDSSEEDPEG